MTVDFNWMIYFLSDEVKMSNMMAIPVQGLKTNEIIEFVQHQG